MVKESFPVPNPKFVKATGYTAIRFEQQDQRAVIFVSNFYDPIKQEYTWSEPYP